MHTRLDAETLRDFAQSSQLEWLLTNGRGGFAMGTASGANTRRYHGHLVAAIDPPAGRMVLLNGYEAQVIVGGEPYGLSTNQYMGAIYPQGHLMLLSFEAGSFVQWVYGLPGTRGVTQQVRKRLMMNPGEEACTVEYTNLGSETVQLTLRPLISHKFYHENFRVVDFYPEVLVFPDDRTVAAHRGHSLTIRHDGAERTPATGWYYRFERRRELERGLDPLDDLFCPCELRYVLAPGESATLVAAYGEEAEAAEFVDRPAAVGLGEMLKESAEAFLVHGGSRHSIIAGYPWFADWGRDTFISLPGICLHTGRTEEAKAILRDYAAAMQNGLIPNRFSDRGDGADYNTVDATLWFANALYRTLKTEWDEALAREGLTWLNEAFEWHEKGTLYGIGVDPEDGLLRQGQEGVQLTWMDAKVGDWVVTPRHGKPVEINGLWINMLRIGEWLAGQLGEPAGHFVVAAERAEAHFEAKFWHPVQMHYLDTADPDDASLRPNQIIAMGLPFSPMNGENARVALSKCLAQLVTPFGVRTLGPDEPGYKGRYEGSLAERDAAYHQGTVWPWLLGPTASALVRLTHDWIGARRLLEHAGVMMRECGLGGIAEVYDGDEPHLPGGCPWQAWSVAEILRAWIEDCGGDDGVMTVLPGAGGGTE